MRQFQAPDFLGNGAGECALLMPEKLAFQQAGRNGGTIQLYKGSLAARTELVDGPRNQILSGAGLAKKENGHILLGNCFHLFQYSFQGDAFSDNVFEPVLCIQLLFEITFFSFLASQLFLGSLFFRKIANDATYRFAAADFSRGEHKVYGKLRAVLAPAVKFKSNSHRTGSRVGA